MHLRLLLVGIIAVGVTVSAAAQTLDRVLAKGVLVMSTDAEYPPQSWLNESGEFVGFDVEVAREVARRLGVTAEFVTPEWQVVIAGDWGDRWDISVNSMAPTRERAEVLDFPAIYYQAPAALAVHEESAIDSVEEASGKAIGVGVKTTYEKYLARDLALDADGSLPFEYRIENPEIRTYDTDSLALDDLSLGDGVRLDAVITTLPTILRARENGYPIRVVGEPLFFEPLAVATDKGDPAFDGRITEIVRDMREDGTLSRLSEKWYGADLISVE